jgi:hypothetical protein
MHKILQNIYHALHPGDYGDDIEEIGYSISDRIIEDCERQWTDSNAPLTFPSKSINVAIIYARLLEHHFNQPFIEYLSDPSLLHGQDRFFKPYPEYKIEYDHMAKIMSLDKILNSTNPSVLKTIAYFNAEFMVGSSEYLMLTREIRRKVH